MFNHEPKNYVCPFCGIAKGVEGAHIYTKQSDIFYRDNFVTAFISSHWWPKNKGGVIIIPNKHIENVYDLPNTLSDKIHRLEKRVAIGLKKSYMCDGVSFRQHNEHHGNQDVWHYHQHVLPRYKNDNLYINHKKKYLSPENERILFAKKLKEFLK